MPDHGQSEEKREDQHDWRRDVYCQWGGLLEIEKIPSAYGSLVSALAVVAVPGLERHRHRLSYRKDEVVGPAGIERSGEQNLPLAVGVLRHGGDVLLLVGLGQCRSQATGHALDRAGDPTLPRPGIRGTPGVTLEEVRALHAVRELGWELDHELIRRAGCRRRTFVPRRHRFDHPLREIGPRRIRARGRVGPRDEQGELPPVVQGLHPQSAHPRVEPAWLHHDLTRERHEDGLYRVPRRVRHRPGEGCSDHELRGYDLAYLGLVLGREAAHVMGETPQFVVRDHACVDDVRKRRHRSPVEPGSQNTVNLLDRAASVEPPVLGQVGSKDRKSAIVAQRRSRFPVAAALLPVTPPALDELIHFFPAGAGLVRGTGGATELELGGSVALEEARIRLQVVNERGPLIPSEHVRPTRHRGPGHALVDDLEYVGIGGQLSGRSGTNLVECPSEVSRPRKHRVGGRAATRAVLTVATGTPLLVDDLAVHLCVHGRRHEGGGAESEERPGAERRDPGRSHRLGRSPGPNPPPLHCPSPSDSPSTSASPQVRGECPVCS